LAPLPDPALGNELVRLRPWTVADIPTLLEAGSDPVVTRFRYSLPLDADQARGWLDGNEQGREQGIGIELAIEENSAPRGSISLWEIDRHHRSAMTSYWLGPRKAAGAGLRAPPSGWSSRGPSENWIWHVWVC
jgi:RimJ/RimL family protein N-acetyltransferase